MKSVHVQNKMHSASGDGSADASSASDASRRLSCMKRVEQAVSRQDLDGLAECFDPDYQSEFPAHPGRAFRGRAQMRKNWTQIFADVPDIRATLVRATADGETVWTEWEWKGTRVDGGPFHSRGVTIQTIPEDQITRAWLYMELVHDQDRGADVATRSTLTQES